MDVQRVYRRSVSASDDSSRYRGDVPTESDLEDGSEEPSTKLGAAKPDSRRRRKKKKRQSNKVAQQTMRRSDCKEDSTRFRGDVPTESELEASVTSVSVQKTDASDSGRKKKKSSKRGSRNNSQAVQSTLNQPPAFDDSSRYRGDVPTESELDASATYELTKQTDAGATNSCRRRKKQSRRSSKVTEDRSVQPHLRVPSSGEDSSCHKCDIPTESELDASVTSVSNRETDTSASDSGRNKKKTPRRSTNSDDWANQPMLPRSLPYEDSSRHRGDVPTESELELSATSQEESNRQIHANASGDTRKKMEAPRIPVGSEDHSLEDSSGYRGCVPTESELEVSATSVEGHCQKTETGASESGWERVKVSRKSKSDDQTARQKMDRSLPGDDSRDKSEASVEADFDVAATSAEKEEQHRNDDARSESRRRKKRQSRKAERKEKRDRSLDRSDVVSNGSDVEFHHSRQFDGKQKNTSKSKVHSRKGSKTKTQQSQAKKRRSSRPKVDSSKTGSKKPELGSMQNKKSADESAPSDSFAYKGGESLEASRNFTEMLDTSIKNFTEASYRLPDLVNEHNAPMLHDSYRTGFDVDKPRENLSSGALSSDSKLPGIDDNSTLASANNMEGLSDEQKVWAGIAKVLDAVNDCDSVLTSDVLSPAILQALKSSIHSGPSVPIRSSRQHLHRSPAKSGVPSTQQWQMGSDEESEDASEEDRMSYLKAMKGLKPDGGNGSDDMPALMNSSFSSIMTDLQSLVASKMTKSEGNAVIQQASREEEALITFMDTLAAAQKMGQANESAGNRDDEDVDDESEGNKLLSYMKQASGQSKPTEMPPLMDSSFSSILTDIQSLISSKLPVERGKTVVQRESSQEEVLKAFMGIMAATVEGKNDTPPEANREGENSTQNTEAFGRPFLELLAAEMDRNKEKSAVRDEQKTEMPTGSPSSKRKSSRARPSKPKGSNALKKQERVEAIDAHDDKTKRTKRPQPEKIEASGQRQRPENPSEKEKQKEERKQTDVTCVPGLETPISSATKSESADVHTDLQGSSSNDGLEQLVDRHNDDNLNNSMPSLSTFQTTDVHSVAAATENEGLTKWTSFGDLGYEEAAVEDVSRPLNEHDDTEAYAASESDFDQAIPASAATNDYRYDEAEKNGVFDKSALELPARYEAFESSHNHEEAVSHNNFNGNVYSANYVASYSDFGFNDPALFAASCAELDYGEASPDGDYVDNAIEDTAYAPHEHSFGFPQMSQEAFVNKTAAGTGYSDSALDVPLSRDLGNEVAKPEAGNKQGTHPERSGVVPKPDPLSPTKPPQTKKKLVRKVRKVKKKNKERGKAINSKAAVAAIAIAEPKVVDNFDDFSDFMTPKERPEKAPAAAEEEPKRKTNLFSFSSFALRGGAKQGKAPRYRGNLRLSPLKKLRKGMTQLPFFGKRRLGPAPSPGLSRDEARFYPEQSEVDENESEGALLTSFHVR